MSKVAADGKGLTEHGPSIKPFNSNATGPRSTAKYHSMDSRLYPVLYCNVNTPTIHDPDPSPPLPRFTSLRSEEDPFVLEGKYTHRVSTEASAQRLIDELTAEHLKREAP